jgi:hypothetical protein
MAREIDMWRLIGARAYYLFKKVRRERFELRRALGDLERELDEMNTDLELDTLRYEWRRWQQGHGIQLPTPKANQGLVPLPPDVKSLNGSKSERSNPEA